MTAKEGSYTEGLIHHIEQEFKQHGLTGPSAFKAESAIKGHVRRVAEDIRFRIRQYAMAELDDLTRQLRGEWHPDGCKGGCDPSKPCKHLEALREINTKED